MIKTIDFQTIYLHIALYFTIFRFLLLSKLYESYCIGTLTVKQITKCLQIIRAVKTKLLFEIILYITLITNKLRGWRGCWEGVERVDSIWNNNEGEGVVIKMSFDHLYALSRHLVKNRRHDLAIPLTVFLVRRSDDVIDYCPNSKKNMYKIGFKTDFKISLKTWMAFYMCIHSEFDCRCCYYVMSAQGS